MHQWDRALPKQYVYFNRIEITMKTTLQALLISLIMVAIYSCEKQEVGYLRTQDVSYTPDSLVVKARLDPEDANDAKIMKYEIPWQSQEIEGVQGTSPITYAIKSIRTDEGNVPMDIAAQFKMVRKGVVQIPFDHKIPIGRYSIGITIKNVNRIVDKDSIFTVIVQ